MGAFRASCEPLGDARGYLKNFLPKNYISENNFSGIFRITFSLCVVARWGHLGIFVSPWGTLGGTEVKNFHAKNFPQNYTSENIFSGIFRITFSHRVVARWGHLGIFVSPWGTLGGTEVKNVHAKKLPQNYTSENNFTGIFRITFSHRVVARWGHLGIFVSPWGTLGGTEAKNFHAKKIHKKLYIRK